MFLKKLRMIGVIFAVLVSWIELGYGDVSISKRQRQLIKTERIFQANKRSVISDISENATLDDYIRIGLQNNSGIRAAFYQWKSSFQKISQAFSLPDPQFTYTEYIESVETRVGPQERAYSINQKVPLPDKLWIRRSKAFKASEEAFYNFEKQGRELVYKITDAYYEYSYLSKAILLTEENIKLLKNFESVAQVRYRSGLTKNQDLLKVQVELGRLENDLLSLKDLRSPLMARLNVLLNLPYDNFLPWPDELLEDAVMDPKYEEAGGIDHEVLRSNPELRSIAKNVEKNEDALRLAKREFFPDLTIGVTQIVTGDAMSPGVPGSGKDPLMVMLSVNVPIWFHRLNAGIQDAKASVKSVENLLENKHNELSTLAAFVHYKLRDALRQSRLYKDALLPKAVQTLHAIQSGYEGGTVDFLSLIDAQRVLLSFQLAYYRHTADFYQRLAELDSLAGEINYYKKYDED